MPLEQAEKGEIAVEVGLLDHAVEVADRLVIMEHEDETNGCGHARARGEATGGAA